MNFTFMRSLLFVFAFALISGANAVIGANAVDDISSRKLFKKEEVVVVDEADKNLLQKYTIHLGTFATSEQANAVKANFQAMNEKPLIVKNANEEYYVLMRGSGYPDIAVLRMKEIMQQYVSGVSVEEQEQKYGIVLDDMYILESAIEDSAIVSQSDNSLTNTTLKKFSVVVVSTSFKNAELLKQKLEEEGYPATITKKEAGVYRVVIATADTREDAQRKRDRILSEIRSKGSQAWLKNKFGISFTDSWMLIQ